MTALSLFRGSFSTKAACFVAGTTVAVLDGLHDQSLVHRAGEERYELHSLWRQYARERLIEGEYAAEARTRYRAYFLGLLRDKTLRLYGMDPRPAVQALRLELDDIHQAWEWAIEQCVWVELADGLAALVRLYTLTGLVEEWATYLAVGARRLRQHCDAGSGEILVLAGHLQAAGATNLILCQRYAEAISAGREILELGKSHQSLSLQAHARLLIASAHQEQGRIVEARGQLEQAMLLAHATGDARLLSQCLARFYAPIETTPVYLQAALYDARRRGDGWQASIILSRLGGMLSYQGDLVGARSHYRAALEYYRALGNERDACYLQNNLGDLSRLLGAYEEAYTFYVAGLRVALELGEQRAEAHIREGLSRLYVQTGKEEAAWQELERALHLFHTLGLTPQIPYLLNTKGRLLLQSGALAEAEAVLWQAVELCEATKLARVVIESYAYLAERHVRSANRTVAFSFTQRIADLLHEGTPLDGYTDRAFIYRVCIESLALVGDVRAIFVARQAQSMLRSTADALDSSEARARYQSVPDHAVLAVVIQAVLNEADLPGECSGPGILGTNYTTGKTMLNHGHGVAQRSMRGMAPALSSQRSTRWSANGW